MNDVELAKVFFHNWVKEPGVVSTCYASPEITEGLKKTGCIVHNYSSKAKACVVNIFDNPNDIPFARIRQFIEPTGILFVRINKNKGDIYSILERLTMAKPMFKIVETYTIGDYQDYLMRPIDEWPRICIGMIAKNEERDLPKCLESLDGITEGMVLVDTGSIDRTEEIFTDWARYQQTKNNNFYAFVETYLGASEKDEKGDWKLWNFSKARNRYCELIEKENFDYILWMDADDILLEKDIWKLTLLEQYDIHGVQIESGSLKWPHHRLWKTGKGIRYSGWCHEYPNWTGKEMVHKHKSYVSHDAAPGPHENSNDRNLRILKRQMEQEPSPRTAFYLANTYKDRGLFKEAVPWYQKRMDYGFGYVDEYWFAVLYKARCEKFSKDLEAAEKTLLYATQMRSDWAEFWMELAFLETAKGNHTKAIDYCLKAKDKPIPPTSLWREVDKYIDQPERTISWAYQHLKDYQKAYEWGLKAKKKIGVPDKSWDDRLFYLQRMKSETEEIKKEKETVVFHRPGAIGDVMMILSLIPSFKKENPNTKVIFRTHPTTKRHLEFLMNMVGVDEIVTERVACDKEIDLIGYPLKEGYPHRKMKRHLLAYFAEEMGIKNTEDLVFEGIELPPNLTVTIHTQAGWSPYKNWPTERWVELVRRIKEEFPECYVIQIGGPDDTRIEGTLSLKDLKLECTVKNSLSVLLGADLHIGVDSWTNHATNFVADFMAKTPAIILWGSTQWQAAGYPHNTNISMNLPCQPCFKEDPKISRQPLGICQNPIGQTYDDPKHQCMNLITVDMVMEEVRKRLE